MLEFKKEFKHLSTIKEDSFEYIMLFYPASFIYPQRRKIDVVKPSNRARRNVRKVYTAESRSKK